MIELNKTAITADLSQEYEKNKKIMIHDIWNQASLKRLTQVLTEDVKYLSAYTLGMANKQSSDEEFKNMSAADLRSLQQSIAENASRGIGFFYGRYEINNNEQNEVLKSLYSYLNSESVLSTVSAITGIKGLKGASVQLTRYTPGNFLTRHNDVLETRQRAVAFVFGFTPQWHPDWGGLLHFFEMNGNLTDTFLPKNNVLSLFDVNLPHSVSYITPFARNARYSITGWFNLK
jgi:SM-20-related protein